MIVPVGWMWEQLDGPVMAGLRDALYSYYYNMLDQKLESLNDLSIATADSALLTVLGMLMGVPRPIVVRQSDNTRLLFAASYYNPSDFGFSAKPGQWSEDNPGGTFSTIWETGEDSGNWAPTNWYRAILSAYADSDGRMGSLTLLDDIITAIRSVDTPSAPPDHRYEFYEEGTKVRAAGDYDILLTSPHGWSDIDIASSLIESVIYGGFAPVPRGNVIMDPDLKTSPLLADALQAQPTLNSLIPPKDWIPMVQVGDTVTTTSTIGTVVGTLDDGSEVEIEIKAHVDGEVSYVPVDVTNWLQDISVVTII